MGITEFVGHLCLINLIKRGRAHILRSRLKEVNEGAPWGGGVEISDFEVQLVLYDIVIIITV